MSKPISASEVPEDLGRNDPCPCGSGRKYKKCCQRAHRLQKETEKKNPQAHELIGAKTIPWKVFKLLGQVQKNNGLGVFFDMAHDEGPFRERFEEKSAFIEAIDAGDEVLPAAPVFELAHIRLDPPDTFLLLREDDPKQDTVRFQLVVLRPNEFDGDGESRDVDHAGPRVWDVQHHKVDRSELDGTPSLDFFGIQWHPAAD